MMSGGFFLLKEARFLISHSLKCDYPFELNLVTMENFQFYQNCIYQWPLKLSQEGILYLQFLAEFMDSP
jgi:hypothetical protein